MSKTDGGVQGVFGSTTYSGLPSAYQHQVLSKLSDADLLALVKVFPLLQKNDIVKCAHNLATERERGRITEKNLVQTSTCVREIRTAYVERFLGTTNASTLFDLFEKKEREIAKQLQKVEFNPILFHFCADDIIYDSTKSDPLHSLSDLATIPCLPVVNLLHLFRNMTPYNNSLKNNQTHARKFLQCITDAGVSLETPAESDITSDIIEAAYSLYVQKLENTLEDLAPYTRFTHFKRQQGFSPTIVSWEERNAFLAEFNAKKTTNPLVQFEKLMHAAPEILRLFCGESKA